MMNGINYHYIDDDGLPYSFLDKFRTYQKNTLLIDNIIICAGQEAYQPLLIPLEQRGKMLHAVGVRKLQ